jgi:hypothetical protein
LFKRAYNPPKKKTIKFENCLDGSNPNAEEIVWLKNKFDIVVEVDCACLQVDMPLSKQGDRAGDASNQVFDIYQK